MDAQTTQTILILVTLVVAVFGIYRSYQATHTVDLTPATLISEVKEAVPVAKQLMEVATIGVQAAEQLKRTGKLPDNDAAFEYALDYIKKNIPYMAGVTNKDIETAIESAVFLVNTLVDRKE